MFMVALSIYLSTDIISMERIESSPLSNTNCNSRDRLSAQNTGFDHARIAQESSQNVIDSNLCSIQSTPQSGDNSVQYAPGPGLSSSQNASDAERGCSQGAQNSSQNAQNWTNLSSCHGRNDCQLMPPPAVPPSPIPFHLAQNIPGFAPFISPSKEGEVPMEFSPGIKNQIEKGMLKDPPKTPGTPTTLFQALSTKESPELKKAQSTGASEMNPAEVFGSPGSPSSEFKAMLDAIDVQESPSGSSDDVSDQNSKDSDLNLK